MDVRVGVARACSDGGGEALEGVDDGLEPDRVEQVELVLRAGQLGVDDRARRRHAEVVNEGAGIIDDHDGVVVAVGYEERAWVGRVLSVACLRSCLRRWLGWSKRPDGRRGNSGMCDAN